MRDSFILLVEDDPDDEALTLRALRGAGVDESAVQVVHDGVEALDFIFARGAFSDRLHAVPPRAVMLDLKLPKLDGFEVLRAVRADPRMHTLPIVVLTSSSEERDVSTSYALGANSYVRKPVEYDQLADAVGRLGSYWLTINEPPPGDH